MNEPLICSICQLPLSLDNCRNEFNTTFGNNAQPINDGRCCDHCDDHVVIPARINALMQSRVKAK